MLVLIENEKDHFLHLERFILDTAFWTWHLFYFIGDLLQFECPHLETY